MKSHKKIPRKSVKKRTSNKPYINIDFDKLCDKKKPYHTLKEGLFDKYSNQIPKKQITEFENEIKSFSQQKTTYKTFKDNDYHFEYTNNNYLIPSTCFMEYMRYIKWSNLLRTFDNILTKEKIKLISSRKSNYQIISDNLSMWIGVNLMDKTNLVDPLIPYDAGIIDTFIKTLHFLGHIPITQAKDVFQKMNLIERTNQIIYQLMSLRNKKVKDEVYYKNEQIVYVNHSHKIKIKLDCSNKVYYHLKNRYTGDLKKFNEMVCCLLLRYKTFNGNSHQFAMTIDFKDALRDTYKIDFECFASAINVHYTNYCSLFYDIEQYFGSFGSFYTLKYHKGFYIANPPYEVIMLLKMVKKFQESCQESKEPLSISYGLPNWGKYEEFEALEITKSSPMTTFYRCMKDGEVYWFDRLRNIKIKIPSHCRSVVQNKKGEKEYDISKFNTLVNKYWVAK